MILLFAAPPYQPMLINSALAIPVITDVPKLAFGTALVGTLIFTGTTTEHVGFGGERERVQKLPTPTLCHCNNPHTNIHYVH